MEKEERDAILESVKEQNKEQFEQFKEESQKAQKDLLTSIITPEQFEEKMTKSLSDLETKLKEENKDDKSSEAIEKLMTSQNELLEALKLQGTELKELKENSIINKDFSVNKDVLRGIVEKHLEDSGVLGGEEENEHGIKVKPVNLRSSHNLNNTAVKQMADLRVLSKKHVNKAGENMFLTGATTQAVFGQAINRFPIGDIAPPLTANEHALDIFNTTNVSGSLMTLLVYENLEDNSELVAEGEAPSADSRIELNSKDFKIFPFSATATISKEILRDSGEVIDELVRQLADGIKTTIDNNLFTATGDNSTTPWGIFNTTHSCETFNPLLFTGTSQQANIISVIGKAKLQARLNDWMADSTLLNPNQWDEIEDLKDLDENSVRDNRLAVNNVGETVAVKGMRKYQTTKMPANTMLIYNSMLQTIGLRQDIETSFGFNNDDFKRRKVSWLMDIRVGYGQKAKESSIYVDNIADAIAILQESAADSLTRVDAYAVASDATDLTIATLINTGAEDVIEANLDGYKTAIAAETGIADLAALQTVIDTVNAA